MNLNDLKSLMDNYFSKNIQLSGTGAGIGGPTPFYLFGFLTTAVDDSTGIEAENGGAVVVEVQNVYTGYPNGEQSSVNAWLDLANDLTTAGRIAAYRKYTPSLQVPGQDVVA